MSKTEWEDCRKFCKRKTRFYGRKRKKLWPKWGYGSLRLYRRYSRQYVGGGGGEKKVTEDGEVEEPRSDDVGTSRYLG